MVPVRGEYPAPCALTSVYDDRREWKLQWTDRPTREPGFGAHTADRIGSKCGETVTFIRLGRK